MYCTKCKCELDEAISSNKVTLGNKEISVYDVPAFVCERCKEVTCSDEVALVLEKSVDEKLLDIAIERSNRIERKLLTVEQAEVKFGFR